MKTQKALILPCLLIILGMFSGCVSGIEQASSQASTETEGATDLEGTAPQSYPIPQENRKARSTYMWGVASTVSDGYFYGREYLRYYDDQSGGTMLL